MQRQVWNKSNKGTLEILQWRKKEARDIVRILQNKKKYQNMDIRSFLLSSKKLGNKPYFAILTKENDLKLVILEIS